MAAVVEVSDEDVVVAAKGVTVLAVTLIASGCGSSNPLGGGTVSGDLKAVVVGSADFPESKIVAEIYAHALEVNGGQTGREEREIRGDHSASKVRPMP